MSQCSRVLEVLRDGRPHSIQEIHERAGTMRLNSRVADLRKMGYLVAYFRKDGLHTYQLLDGGAVRESEEVHAADGTAVSDPPTLGPSSAERSSTSGAGLGSSPLKGEDPDQGWPQQLTVWSSAA